MRSRRRAEALARRLAASTGIEEVLRLKRRVEDLTEAVAENAALEVPLAARVAELEQSLIGALEDRQRLLDSR